jgi:hypothetical protein
MAVGGKTRVQTTDAPHINSEVTVSAVASGKDSSIDSDVFNVDFSSANGTQEVKFGDQVLLEDDYEAGGEGGRIYRYMGGGAKTIDLSQTDYTDTGYWFLLPKLPTLLNDTKDFLDLVRPAAAAPSVNGQVSGTPGKSAVQQLVLKSTSPAGAGAVQPASSFKLTLDGQTTAPIRLLPVGTAADELQSLTFIQTSDAVDSPYTLKYRPPADGSGTGSLAQAKSKEMTFLTDPGANAAAIEAVLVDWFGQGNVKVSYDANRSHTQGSLSFGAGGLVFMIALGCALSHKDIGQI